jgi:guanylate kinase
MTKPLLLFVGKSSSGKTTIANILEKEHGYKQVQSYTTRKPRYEGEIGHIFVTEKEFNKLGRLAAYTLYNGHKYGTTFKQIDKCDIYVIDVPGVETLLKNYKTGRPIYIIYFDVSVYNRINRMIERGDHDGAIISRLLEDEKEDWLRGLRDVVSRSGQSNAWVYVVDANEAPDNVIEQIFWYVNF